MANNNEVKVTFKAFTQEFNKAIGELKGESSKLNQEFKLQQEQMKLTATTSEKLAAKIEYLRQAQDLANKQVDEAASALTRAKTLFGENSVEADKMARKLTDAQYSAQKLSNELTQTTRAQEQVAQATKQLNTLFDATGTSVDDFAHSLGSQLTNAIKNGTASSRQLEMAIEKIGREALGTDVDIGKMKQALASVDDGASLKSVKKDLNGLSKEAESAQGSVKELGGELAGLAAGALAGGGVAGIIEKSLDVSSLNTKIAISFDVSPESMESVKSSINTVTSYGVDAESALEGVRRQWALNKDASDESNQAVVNGAATVAAAYNGVDFTELIQEVNEISSELGITNEEALGLTNALLKIGFPPEQIDTIAEYGRQLTEAGYTAEEVQAIMTAGVETGTWNIDNLLDGLKEGRIKLAEFGQEVPKATAELLQGTNISTQQLQEWGKAVAAGGEGGKKAMQEVAQALVNVEDETQRNALGTQFFGTMWEDQGTNITDTILNMNDHLTTSKENIDGVNSATEQMNADPAVQMQQAFSDMIMALSPLLTKIAEFVGKIAHWISENPKLAATITAVVTAIGILMGIIMALAPIFTAISAAATTLGIGLSPLIGIVVGIVAAIAALIAIGVLVYQNWDTIKAKAIEIWSAIKEWFSSFWEETKQLFNSSLEAISTFLSDTWNSIKETASSIWTAIKEFFTKYWAELLIVFTGPLGVLVALIIKNWDKIKETSTTVWNAIKDFFSTLWNGIKSVFSTVISAIISFVIERWNNLKTNTSNIFNAVKTTISNIWNNVKTTVSNTVESIKNVVRDKFEALKGAVSEKMQAAKGKIVEIWNQAKSFLTGINLASIGKDIIQGLINGIKSKLGAIKNAMKDAADAITGKVKSLLQIKSPSRVLMKLGNHVGEGLAIGIEKMKKTVSAASGVLAENAIPSTGGLPGFIGAAKQRMESGLELIANVKARPMHITVVSELDGYEIARATYPYSDDMMTADVDKSAVVNGVKW